MFGKVSAMLLAAVALMVSMVATVQAALPAAAATAFDTLETDGLALIDLAWIPVSLIAIGFVILKLFKRGANKV
jgi:hypothetical protein